MLFFLHVKTNFREISGLFNVENVFVLKAQAELLCKEIAKLCTWSRIYMYFWALAAGSTIDKYVVEYIIYIWWIFLKSKIIILVKCHE